jgi:hypothetical protein
VGRNVEIKIKKNKKIIKKKAKMVFLNNFFFFFFNFNFNFFFSLGFGLPLPPPPPPATQITE